MNKHYKIAILFILLLVTSLWIFHAVSENGKLLQRHKLITKQVGIKPEVISTKGRVAIILDDWGYNSSDLALLFKIKEPIAVSILPNLRYSEQVARDVKIRGYQTMLHLPLESRHNEIPEQDTVYCAMSKDEIIKSLRLSLKSVPGVAGVNNHQGSKATENDRLMKIILGELKKDNLFFLDSVTTSKSVCPAIAKEIGIKHAKRDIFFDEPPSKLDDKEQALYIQKQLYKLSDLAISKGYAIGIGHDKKITLKVLKDVLPQLERKGIKFVFVSTLVHN